MDKRNHDKVAQNNRFSDISFDVISNPLTIYQPKESAARHCSAFEAKNACRRTKAIQNSIDFINDNLNKELSLAAIADKANISAFHFARLFKILTGLPPHQFIMKAKMKKATELLCQTDLSVNVIASEIGYTSSHFVQTFKSCYGITPLQFRSRVHQSIGSANLL